MKVEFIECDVLKRLKCIKLKGSHLKPYQNAYISYKIDYPRNYLPCQNYLLWDQIKMMAKIDEESRKQTGHRINNLNNGYLKITTEQGIATFLPPIIEKDYFFNGDYIINDGMHRMYYAMNFLNDSIRMVVVDGATCPYYSYPTTWDNVELLRNTIPDDFVKKVHRVKEYKKLYRDFNSIFKFPVGNPRGRLNNDSVFSGKRRS